MKQFFDSFEVERLRKLIAHKETYLQTLAANKNKAAYQITQNEVMFLKNDLLPIIQSNSNIIHSEFVKYSVRAFDAALTHKCNGLLIYQPIHENYTDRPIIGIVNSSANQQPGAVGAIEVYIDNMDLMGSKVQPMNINFNTLI